MTMMAYWGDDAVEVYHTDPRRVWVVIGWNLPNEMRQRRANILIAGPPDADQAFLVDQMIREMRMVRVGEWGTAPDGRGKWAAEVAWMAGVAGE